MNLRLIVTLFIFSFSTHSYAFIGKAIIGTGAYVAGKSAANSIMEPSASDHVKKIMEYDKNTHYPIRGENVSVLGAYGDGPALVYRMEVHSYESDIKAHLYQSGITMNSFKNEIISAKRLELCQNRDAKIIMSKGVIYRYYFNDYNGIRLFDFDITQYSC